MKILRVAMFMLQIQICVLTFALVTSKENIYVETSLSSHSFPTIIRSKFNLLLFVYLLYLHIAYNRHYSTVYILLLFVTIARNLSQF